MKICKKCNCEYADSLNFCSICGSKLETEVVVQFCAYCGKRVEYDGDFCPYCGGTLKIQYATIQQDKLLNDNNEPDREQGTNNKTTIVEKKSVNTMDKESLVSTMDEESIASKFFSYNGSISRSTFAIRWLPQSFIVISTLTLMGRSIRQTGDTFAAFLGWMIFCIWLISELSLKVRRLRNLGKSNGSIFFLIILGIIPIIGIFVLGYELFAKGEGS